MKYLKSYESHLGTFDRSDTYIPNKYDINQDLIQDATLSLVDNGYYVRVREDPQNSEFIIFMSLYGQDEYDMCSEEQYGFTINDVYDDLIFLIKILVEDGYEFKYLEVISLEEDAEMGNFIRFNNIEKLNSGDRNHILNTIGVAFESVLSKSKI